MAWGLNPISYTALCFSYLSFLYISLHTIQGTAFSPNTTQAGHQKAQKAAASHS